MDVNLGHQGTCLVHAVTRRSAKSVVVLQANRTLRQYSHRAVMWKTHGSLNLFISIPVHIYYLILQTLFEAVRPALWLHVLSNHIDALLQAIHGAHGPGNAVTER